MKMILAGIMILCFALSATVFAEEQGKVSPTTKLTQEEIRQLQEGAATLGKAFGISPDVKPSAKENEDEKKEVENKPAEKTFANVADKGLDMVKNLVISLSQTLEKTAPQIWRVMVKQQYAKAIADLILPWSLLLVTIIYAFMMKKMWKWSPEYNNMELVNFHDNEDIPYPTKRGWRGFLSVVLPFCGGCFFTIWGCVVLKSSLLLLINPEYYAVRDLLLMIMNPSAIP